MTAIPALLQKLQEEFKATTDDLKGLVKTQAAEIKAHGQTTTNTAEKITTAETRLDQSVADIKGTTGDLETKYGSLETELKSAQDELKAAVERLDEFEKAPQRPGWGADSEELKSVGEAFVEGSEYKNLVETKSDRSAPMVVPQLFPAWQQKATLLTSASERLVVPFRTEMVTPALRQLNIRNLMPVTETTSNAIEYIQEVGFAADGAAPGTQTHGAAAETAEGQPYPEAQIEFETKTAAVRNIGHWLAMSRNAIDDAPQVRSHIDNRLIYGVPYKEDLQILYGDNLGSNLQGIMTHPNRQTYAWSAGQVGDTKIDALRRAATRAYIQHYSVDGYVLNPLDWEDIQLMKGNDQHYIWLVISAGTEETIWKVPVVVTNAMQQGESVVGSWRLGAELWDRQETVIRVADQHEGYAVAGKVAVIAEERVAAVWYRPDAFVAVDFDNAPVP